MRLIDADALIAWTDNYYDSEKFTVGHFANMVKDMPTIEERKTGKWVRALDGNDGHVRCNKCFKIYDWDTQAQYYDFCPKCGAKMEEGEQE